MRKNKMMRAASALLVAVLLTTCAISGTFAKYVTQDDFSDTARVAKWGVELQLVGNLYGDTYQNALVANDAGASIAVQASDAVIPVSQEGSDIVAPGTENSNGLSIYLAGQPEVDGIIDVSITTSNVYLEAGTYGVMIPVEAGFITEDNFDEYLAQYNTVETKKQLFVLNNGTFTAPTAWADTTYYTLEDVYTLGSKYYPVVYTLTGNTSAGGTIADDTLKAAATAIIDQFNGSVDTTTETTNGKTTYTAVAVKFDSNKNLEEYALDNLKLTWAWDFENVDDKGTVDTSDDVCYDGADTIIGTLQSLGNTVAAGAPSVVKLGNSADIYGALTQYKDYCLNSEFIIDISVTQTN